MAIIGETPDLRLLAPQELRAWRGMLRAQAALAKALDAQLDAAHGLQQLLRGPHVPRRR